MLVLWQFKHRHSPTYLWSLKSPISDEIVKRPCRSRHQFLGSKTKISSCFMRSFWHGCTYWKPQPNAILEAKLLWYIILKSGYYMYYSLNICKFTKFVSGQDVNCFQILDPTWTPTLVKLGIEFKLGLSWGTSWSFWKSNRAVSQLKHSNAPPLGTWKSEYRFLVLK